MRIAIVCSILIFAQSIRAQLFEEVSDVIGLTYSFPGIGNQAVGSGVTVFDVNNDGWDDIFQSAGIFESKLWINEQGVFVDRTKDFELQFLAKYFVQSSVAGDFNNDGFEDLFLSNFGMARFGGDKLPPMLLMNVDGKKLIPVCTLVFSKPAHITCSTWGDVNLDGYLDLFSANYLSEMNHIYDTLTFDHKYDPNCLGNKFYMNSGGTNFIDRTAEFEMDNKGCGLAATFSDYDKDGDVDLLLLNDFGEWNHLGNQFYRNNYPVEGFSEVSKEIGFYKEMYGMGIGPGDYDQDGDLDYYITNIGQNSLLKNENGKFIDVALDLGLDVKMYNDSLFSTSWSGLFFDYDNDIDLDLYVNKGNVLAETPKTAVLDPNEFFLNEGSARFVDVSEGSGIDDPLSHRGAALLDFDHDGDLDIVSAVLKLPWGDFGNYDQKIKFYKNLNKSKNNWIGIKLVGSGNTNRSCIGCSLLAETPEGTIYKEVDAGSGHGSQSTKIQYFGLKKNKRLASLTIYWLGGKTTTLMNLKAKHVYEVSEEGVLRVVY